MATDTKLSKALSYGLRHNPAVWGLQLDKDGFLPITDVSFALDRQGKYGIVTVDRLMGVVNSCEKQRYELQYGTQGTKIRAKYGHSLSVTRVKSVPPKFLYHATILSSMEKIGVKGLHKMGRQNVHLSNISNLGFALEAGARRLSQSTDDVVYTLEVDTEKAQQQGISFYQASEGVWLADFVPSSCVRTVPELSLSLQGVRRGNIEFHIQEFVIQKEAYENG